MKVRAAHIFPVMAVLFFLAGCSCSKTKVIPRGKMAEIYAEMLVMDQWIAGNPRIRTQADTSLVYEPIFESYGYTTEDYRASVEHYMKDPERYSRILRRTTEILDERILELKEIKRIEDRRKSIKPYELDSRRLYFGRDSERLWWYGDSVSVAVDSLSPVYELSFHGIKDSLAVSDSISIKDEEKPDPAKQPDSAKQPELKPVVEKIPSGLDSPRRLFSTTLDSLKRK